MNASKLFIQLEKYGADMSGINDRFIGDKDFYAECFCDFLKDASFAQLDEAVASRDGERLFSAAHALKGISANLGLTPFYKSICVLVESLRGGIGNDVSAEYDAVVNERRRLDSLLIQSSR